MATPARYLWKPSTARVAVLDGFAPVPRGTPQTVPPQLAWPAKDPADSLDYVFDISEALIGDDDDLITTLDVAISPAQPGDLTLVSASVDAETAILWLSGGQSGTIYSVTLSFGLASGRTLARSISLPVLSMATQAVPAAAITDQTGAVLVDQSGAPILIGS